MKHKPAGKKLNPESMAYSKEEIRKKLPELFAVYGGGFTTILEEDEDHERKADRN